MFDPKSEDILKVIDFVNHHYAAHARVTGTYTCSYSEHFSWNNTECGKNFPDGIFTYNAGGFTPGPSMIKLRAPTGFPLHYMHILPRHEKEIKVLSEQPKDNRKTKCLDSSVLSLHSDNIFELFRQSSSWQIYDVPDHVIEPYEKVMKLQGELLKANARMNNWFNLCHTTPDYTEAEMQADPSLRRTMELEKEITGQSDKLILSVKPEILYLMGEIVKDRALPPNFITEDVLKSINPSYKQDENSLLPFQFSFLEDTYDTFKAKKIFFSTEAATKIIASIDSCIEEGMKVFSETSPF